MTEQNKPSVKIYFEEVENHYVRNEAVIINEDTHPELKGMTQGEMVEYVRNNMEKMKSTDEYSNDLMEQAATMEQDWDKYTTSHTDYVVEPYSEEDSEDVDDSEEED